MKAALLAAMLVATGWLSGCDNLPAGFNGINLAGAGFGREFSLTDPDGRERTLADFRGKYVMMFFGYTQCPDVCPTALARAVAVRQKLGVEADRLQVIFVTVDPERDTPVVLKAYTTAFDPTFLGLRGDETRTKEVAGEFRAFYAKVPTGSSYAMDHSAITYVLDASGRLRLGLQHSLTAEQFAADLQTLMKIDSNTNPKEST
jgi:protein SCO1/2